MGSSRQEYWDGLPCPPPGALPDPGTEPASPAPPVQAGGFFTTGVPGSQCDKHKRTLFAKLLKNVSFHDSGKVHNGRQI